MTKKGGFQHDERGICLEFRKAEESDLINMTKIIRQAQDYFKENALRTGRTVYECM